MLTESNKNVFSNSSKVRSSDSGIKELDAALSGGFPEGSVVLVSGASGSGKTIFCWEWLFCGARGTDNCLYVTLSEPLFTAVRNVEGLSFYDRKAIESGSVRIADLRDSVFSQKGFDHDVFLNYIEHEVKKHDIKRLVIDSFSAVAFAIQSPSHIRNFMFRLSKVLATLGCTTVLTNEVSESAQHSLYGIEEFLADVIMHFEREQKKNQHLLRKINIVKARGRATYIGELDFKISTEGVQITPPLDVTMDAVASEKRVSIGSHDIDYLLHGGVLEGSTTLLAGMTGTGKSSLCLAFLMDGLKHDENCLFVGFEESENQLKRNAKSFGWNIDLHIKKGSLIMLCSFPHEKLLEEHLQHIKEIVESKNCTRVVIDSLTAVSHSYSYPEFIGFTRRLNGYLKSVGCTVVLTMVNSSLISDDSNQQSLISTITDNLITMRHVEMQGELQQVLNVVKIRGSTHSKDLVEYEITSDGLKIGSSLAGYEGILTGSTRKVDQSIEEKLYAEFSRFLGDAAEPLFKKAKEHGFQPTKVMETISQLEKEGVVKGEQAEFFKSNIKDIFGHHAVRMQDPDVRAKIADFFEDKDEKKAFMKKYFPKK